MRLRVATYNIHRGRGLDGLERLDRILAVLAELEADVLALQEVLAPQARVLAGETGMHAVFAPIRTVGGGAYGNLCLSRLPLAGHASYSLTCRPYEPRGCLRADVACGAGRLLHVFNVHLGLRYRERVHQARLLRGILNHATVAGPRVLLGDFNEWFDGRASRLLHAEFGPSNGGGPHRATHPSLFPVLPLDRIYHDPSVRVDRVGVHRSRLARIASDHLPAYADLRVEVRR